MSIELLRVAKLAKQLDEAHTEFILFFEYNLPKIQSSDRFESVSATVSVAGFIQSIYTKAEEVFKCVAKHIDQVAPAGDGWHKELLEQMTFETDERSPVISKLAYEKLDKILIFRHVVRSNYAGELIPSRIIENAKICIDAIQALTNDLKDFCGDSREWKPS